MKPPDKRADMDCPDCYEPRRSERVTKYGDRVVGHGWKYQGWCGRSKREHQAFKAEIEQIRGELCEAEAGAAIDTALDIARMIQGFRRAWPT